MDNVNNLQIQRYYWSIHPYSTLFSCFIFATVKPPNSAQMTLEKRSFRSLYFTILNMLKWQGVFFCHQTYLKLIGCIYPVDQVLPSHYYNLWHTGHISIQVNSIHFLNLISMMFVPPNVPVP